VCVHAHYLSSWRGILQAIVRATDRRFVARPMPGCSCNRTQLIGSQTDSGQHTGVPFASNLPRLVHRRGHLPPHAGAVCTLRDYHTSGLCGIWTCKPEYPSRLWQHTVLPPAPTTWCWPGGGASSTALIPPIYRWGSIFPADRKYGGRLSCRSRYRRATTDHCA